MSRPDIDVTQGEWSDDAAYTNEEKREWLETLPLHSLIGYIMSIEQSESRRPSTILRLADRGLSLRICFRAICVRLANMATSSACSPA